MESQETIQKNQSEIIINAQVHICVWKVLVSVLHDPQEEDTLFNNLAARQVGTGVCVCVSLGIFEL